MQICQGVKSHLTGEIFSYLREILSEPMTKDDDYYRTMQTKDIIQLSMRNSIYFIPSQNFYPRSKKNEALRYELYLFNSKRS